MPNAYIHPSTQQQLDILVHDLPQSIVLTGPEGVGLTAAVQYVADALKVTPVYVLPEKDEKIDLEKGTITVDIIRRLYSSTKTIEKGTRLIVIDYGERMATQAQNAFLKLLEEPGVNTHFILLTHAVSKLLPTIRSRVQTTEIRPITSEQSAQLLGDLKVTDAQKKTQLLFIATGLPALMTRLATDDKAFETRAQVVRDARTYLQGTAYDRLKLAQEYKDDRTAAATLLIDAMKLLKGSLSNTQHAGQVMTISKLLKAHERIEANGNVKLQLAALVL